MMSTLLMILMCLGPLAPCPADDCNRCSERTLSGHVPPCLPGTASIGSCLISTCWDTFIALNWPPEENKRGVPFEPDNPEAFSKSRKYGVWQTWKQEWELFRGVPTPWDSFDASDPICDCIVRGEEEQEITPEQWPDIYKYYRNTVLTMFEQPRALPDLNTKEAAFEQRFESRPLIDQNSQYVWYDVRYNKAAYEYLRTRELSEKLIFPASTATQEGAIIVKAAFAVEPNTGGPALAGVLVLKEVDGRKKCYVRDVQLIGLHISQKYAQINCAENDPDCTNPLDEEGNLKSKWLWSTFERNDLVAPGKARLFDAKLEKGYDYLPDPIQDNDPFCNRLKEANKCVPVNVARIKPMSPTVNDENIMRKAMLPSEWQRFDLIASQWMSSQNKPMPEGDYAVASTVIDTYSQEKTCHDCHQAATDDFVFMATPEDKLYYLVQKAAEKNNSGE